VTAAKLRDVINKVPDEAVVYVESDHGQSAEQAGHILVCYSPKQPYYGDDLGWEEIDENTEWENVRSVLIA
jgi:hypothetical protein